MQYTKIVGLIALVCCLLAFSGCAWVAKAPTPTDNDDSGAIQTVEPFDAGYKDRTSQPSSQEYQQPKQNATQTPRESTNKSGMGVAPTEEGFKAWQEEKRIIDHSRPGSNPGNNPGHSGKTNNPRSGKYKARYQSYHADPWTARVGQNEDALRALGLKSIWLGGFAPNSSDLPKSGKKKLQNASKWKVLRIVGNSSSAGSLEMNKRLSLQRAKKTAYHLEQKGADLSQTVLVGQGPTNKYGEYYKHNRCVTVIIMAR